MNVQRRRTPHDAVEHAWLEKVAGEMLADTRWLDTQPPPAPTVQTSVHSTVHNGVSEDRPPRRQRRATQRDAKDARDGYGRPLRQAQAAAPQGGECFAQQDTPRSGHPLGITKKVLLGAALTSVSMGLSSGLAFADPVTQNNTGGVLDRAAAPAETARPTVKVVIVGDSYTSGEGANSGSYRTAPVTHTTPDGITYQSYDVDPAHQSSTAPSLQALNQIQQANPGADIQVTFVPVSGATRDSLYQTTRPGTPFEQPAQINAVKDADVVVVGIGGNDARFSDWVKTALSSTDSSSAQQFPQFMQQFNDGTYLNNQVKLLNDVSNMASPNATIVSLGYPKAMPDTIPGSSAYWNPFSWSTISQGEANRSNQLATTLNTNNQDASFIAQSQHPGQQWLFADVSTALQGHELFTNQEGLNGLTPSNIPGSYHPNDLGQRLLSSVLQPYVEQAVNSQLSRQGMQGAENVPTVTPTFSSQWNLRVDVPLQVQAQQQAAQAQQAEQAQQQADQQPAQQNDQQPADQQPTDQQPTQQNDQPPAAPADQPAAPADQQQPADQPAAPADQQQPADQPADQPAAPADQPADQPGAPADTPAEPAPGEQPAEPAPAEQPAEPAPAEQPAAPAEPAPAEQPAAPAEPAPAEQPAAPAEPAPAEPAPAPVAPEPAPITDVPINNVPINDTPINNVTEPIAPPPPEITPVEPPAETPVNPVDTAPSGDVSGGVDSGGFDSGSFSGSLDGGGFDSGGFSGGDGGGGGE